LHATLLTPAVALVFLNPGLIIVDRICVPVYVVFSTNK
jgi:hypothetical protein